MPHSSTSRRAWLASAIMLAVLVVVAVTLHAAMIQPVRPGQASSQRAGDTSFGPAPKLIIYCGRSESLVGELINRFRHETGADVEVKYGRTGTLAALILEEGKRSPADVFFAQDPGGLGLLAERDVLRTLPEELLDRVPYAYRDPHERWVGITGRLRTLSYSTQRVASNERPASLLDLTEPQWRGRVGWAPANASFQAMITAMRHQIGESETEQWLRGMIENDVRVYPRNTAIIQGIHDGEIDLGLVNHYYLHRFLEEHGELPIANHFPAGRDGLGDIGGAMLVSGAAILDSARHPELAQRFIEFLLDEAGQSYFASHTFEYPLAANATPADRVPALETLPVRPVNLNELGDLEATIALLRRVGALR